MHIIYLFLVLFLASCQKNPPEIKRDFETLMGKDLPAWQYVQTEEDFKNLHFFKTLFEENCALLKKSESLKIPKLIHFIWVGPKSFPQESVENVKSWMTKHPGWRVKFWTDRHRPLPHPAMELCRIEDFPLQYLGSCYEKSDNYGEKSDLLRYEILYREGGVYVDHDIICLEPFDAHHYNYDLYCGLQMPDQTPLNSSVLVTNNLIGAKSRHPVLFESIQWLIQNWDPLELAYPGVDRDAVINRVSHRTFSVLGECLKKFGNKSGNIDIAFPAFYFDAPQQDLAISARHLFSGTWFENETSFEKATRKRLMVLSKKANQTLQLVGLLSVLNLMGFTSLFFLFKKQVAGS